MFPFDAENGVSSLRQPSNRRNCSRRVLPPPIRPETYCSAKSFPEPLVVSWLGSPASKWTAGTTRPLLRSSSSVDSGAAEASTESRPENWLTSSSVETSTSQSIGPARTRSSPRRFRSPPPSSARRGRASASRASGRPPLLRALEPALVEQLLVRARLAGGDAGERAARRRRRAAHAAADDPARSRSLASASSPPRGPSPATSCRGCRRWRRRRAAAAQRQRRRRRRSS